MYRIKTIALNKQERSVQFLKQTAANRFVSHIFIGSVMKKLFYPFICLLSFFSCTNHTTSIVFPVEKSLSAIQVPVNEMFSADFITKKSNYLFIISVNSDTTIYMYSLPDLKFVKNFGLKGKGPEEFQLPMFVESSGDDLILWGYSKLNLVRRFAIDSNAHIVKKKDYHLKKYETFNQMHLIRDSILVYSLVPTQYVIQEYDLKNQEYSGKIELKPDQDNDNPSLYSNRGVMTANDSSIVYVYNFKRQIDIYDSETLSLKKTLAGNYTYQKPTNHFNENVKYYLDVIPGKKYFYALYRGDSEKNAAENTDAVEVFTYDGTPVIRYKFDISPDIFYVDEENGVMYGYVYKYPDVLFKYVL